MKSDFDVVVVGGGHAGVEACVAATRMHARALLVTSNLSTIGQMSCNPAIGGIAKGTVVREIDALGGVMGQAADRATIQFRMLNRGKGPAVWAPRAQCDRVLYRQAIRSLLDTQCGLSLLEGTVASLIIRDGRLHGVCLTDGSCITCATVIVTAGTFLRGRIHIGTRSSIPGGRTGEPPAVTLGDQLEALGLAVSRFKTGTPPRIDGRTVDFDVLERQDTEMPDFRFSHFVRVPPGGVRPCWIAWAGEDVKSFIVNHLRESSLYGGAISGRGPRYCPSIEDKVVKFPKAPRHQVFLEPEGLNTAEMYVNGLSTSLPAGIQLAMLRRIRGLEQVEMTRAGYAIEYDCYPPTQLTECLEVRAVPSLFFAGQINGTTGYEEAAAQGVVAGLNAVARLRGEEPVVFNRTDAYMGVMTDDLTSKGVDEPYRLFTSRAEFRLLLRQDNALRRMLPVAERLGLLNDAEREVAAHRLRSEEAVRHAAESARISEADARALITPDGPPEATFRGRVSEVAVRSGLSLERLLRAAGVDLDWCDWEAFHAVAVDLKYAGYIAREARAADEIKLLYDATIPADICYAGVAGLSTEAKEKLSGSRPGSLGGAARIPGVSASDLYHLSLEITRQSEPA